MIDTDVTPESLREELRSWLAKSWDTDISLVEWRNRLVDACWAMPSWPSEWYGRGLASWADDLVRSEILEYGAVGLPVGSGVSLAAPTILAHGPDVVRQRYLRSTLTGEQVWCQLFSEPSAGSDLAGLTTRAELDGDEWVISGQKVWNTSAHHADLAMLVARTDWDAPKHRGITYFVLPMHQEGIEVRPLRQMNDKASFNEVFLTEARLPRDNVVGEINEGWRAALTTLAFERRFGAIGRISYSPGPGRALAEARAEADSHFKTYDWYPQRAGRVDLIIDHAMATGAHQDPIVRQEIARLLSLFRISGWTAERARAALSLGRTPGPEGSIGKLATSHVARQAAYVHSLIAGPAAMLRGPDSPLGGVIAEILVSVPAQSIAGGTDEIQHNILGERHLGLPREGSAEAHQPFRQIPRN